MLFMHVCRGKEETMRLKTLRFKPLRAEDRLEHWVTCGLHTQPSLHTFPEGPYIYSRMMKQHMRLKAPKPGSTRGLARQLATPAETDLGDR
jgi:hypothetical protein